MHSTYDILKDFAGPVAAIIGAFAASIVALSLGRSQWRIAASQRDIALDKLKFDLFQHRYEVYQGAKEILEYVPFIDENQKSDSARVRALYVKLDEARFYFPPAICSVLSDIQNRCELFFLHLSMRANTNIDNTEYWTKLAEMLARDQSMIQATYASLPSTFESALAFKQLTTAS
jgi:hypothetical protein